MKWTTDSRVKFRLAIGTGALLALVLCVQCIRTYRYTDAVLVPEQAQREAERQAIALGNAARSAGITDAGALAPAIEHAMESSSDRILWVRVRDWENRVRAQGGTPDATMNVPTNWRERMARNQPPGLILPGRGGPAYVTLLPFRIPRPGRSAERPREAGYAIEMAISLKAVSRTFDGLRGNLIVGLIASMALLASMIVIGLRTPEYLRGKYLESEMEMARRVQRDLQPKPHAFSEDFEFAASAVAADHVGGDFYDVFEAAPGKTAIVLGDVSGKGVSAALLVGLLQGAIRSSVWSQHEAACERMNIMLCERTARTRFATLFWGIFDSESGILQYVNAGHAAPMLMSAGQSRIQRLDQGGPVLGLLPMSRYSAGSVRINAGDTLVIYSDGVNEAANAQEEEFGEDRLIDVLSKRIQSTPEELCERVMDRVAAFASAGPPPDDRTLMVVRFKWPGIALPHQNNAFAEIQAVA